MDTNAPRSITEPVFNDSKPINILQSQLYAAQAHIALLREALEHLEHNARKSGANMGLALDVASKAIAIQHDDAALIQARAQDQAHIAMLRDAIFKFRREPALGNLVALRATGGYVAMDEAVFIQSDDAALREWGARLLEDMANAANEYQQIYAHDLRRRAAELRSGK